MSDIPRDLIRRAENGKNYLNIDIVEMREPGKYGDTHFIAVSCKQADRKEGVNYIIGHAKTSVPANVKQANDDDMF